MTVIATPIVKRCRKHEFERQSCWCGVRHIRCAFCGKPKAKVNAKEIGRGVPTKVR